MKSILILIIIYSMVLPLRASVKEAPGDGRIAGKVVDQGSRGVLEYANVVLYRAGDSALVTGTVTGPDGQFMIRKIPYGEYYLVVQFIGYKKKTIQDIRLNRQQPDLRFDSLEIEPSVSGLREVEISAEKPAVEYKVDKKVVNVASNPAASGGTAADALQNVPSVSVDAEGNVTVRGSSNYTVLIDGRPTALSAADVLKTTPASTIDNIEVITNPSARYDPDGTAGIINLIMKKQKAEGFTGIVNGGVMTGDKYNGDFTLTRRVGKWNCFVGADIMQRKMKIPQKLERENQYDDSTLFIRASTLREHCNTGKTLRGGIDFDMSASDLVSLNIDHGINGFDRLFPNRYYMLTRPQQSERWTVNDNSFDLEGRYTMATLYYQHKFAVPGHEISFTAYRSGWRGTRTDSRLDQPANPDFTPSGEAAAMDQSENNTDRVTLRVKADYARPFGEKHKLEAGIQFDDNHSDFDYLLKEYEPGQGSWVVNPEFTNAFIFRQNLYSTYLTWTGEAAGFEYQAGLRYEKMDRTVDQQTSGQQVGIVFEHFFPSFHLTRKMKHEQQLQLSFSKRINRPAEWMLNPFPMYSDGTFINRGNPYLKPDFSYNTELNYLRRFKKSSVSMELFHSLTKQNISQAFKLNGEGILESTFDNLGSISQTGLELNTSLTLKSWFSLNVVARLYHQQISTMDQYQISESEATPWSVQLIPRLNFKTGTQVQLVGYYYSDQTFAQGVAKASGQLDMVIRQDFLKKRLTVAVRGTNVFGLSKNVYELEGYRFLIWQSLEMEKNTFGLSLSYRINNYKRVIRRNDAVETDQGNI
ncbi:MAG TPA: outer membrane beta-barrel family protein [Bacteroidales bacterium]|nr:outer membrane beta-barrel family protein [Bacteroidales bacterium]HSA42477.1 outer membrane beta-barrel family protein [Bacteroidales bacterium]